MSAVDGRRNGHLVRIQEMRAPCQGDACTTIHEYIKLLKKTILPNQSTLRYSSSTIQLCPDRGLTYYRRFVQPPTYLWSKFSFRY